MPNKEAVNRVPEHWCDGVEMAKILAFMAFSKTVKCGKMKFNYRCMSHSANKAAQRLWTKTRRQQI
ncbi:MAG: hypothetical protein WAO71_09735 [Gallionella sp.]